MMLCLWGALLGARMWWNDLRAEPSGGLIRLLPAGVLTGSAVSPDARELMPHG